MNYNITTLNDFTEAYYHSVPFAYLMVSSVITTILELIVFVGIMFNEANKNVPVFWPILVISLIIAVLQSAGGIGMQLIGAALGLVYGFIYLSTSSIWSVILIGIVFNTSLFGMKKVGWVDAMENMSEFDLIAIASIMGLYLFFSTLWYVRKPNQASRFIIFSRKNSNF